MYLTLEVRRGPRKYDYENVVVCITSECENLLLEDMYRRPMRTRTNLSIHYIRPCSPVEFAGQLLQAGAWHINAASGEELPIVARNPAQQHNRWEDNRRLESVVIEYRRASEEGDDSKWVRVLDRSALVEMATAEGASRQLLSRYRKKWGLQDTLRPTERDSNIAMVEEGAEELVQPVNLKGAIDGAGYVRYNWLADLPDGE